MTAFIDSKFESCRAPKGTEENVFSRKGAWIRPHPVKRLFSLLCRRQPNQAELHTRP